MSDKYPIILTLTLNYLKISLSHLNDINVLNVLDNVDNVLNKWFKTVFDILIKTFCFK
jgi:hypothetical protein